MPFVSTYNKFNLRFADKYPAQCFFSSSSFYFFFLKILVLLTQSKQLTSRQRFHINLSLPRDTNKKSYFASQTQRRAASMTRSFRNRRWHLLTSALDISKTVQLTVTRSLLALGSCVMTRAAQTVYLRVVLFSACIPRVQLWTDCVWNILKRKLDVISNADNASLQNRQDTQKCRYVNHRRIVSRMSNTALLIEMPVYPRLSTAKVLSHRMRSATLRCGAVRRRASPRPVWMNL